jgi:hypothetical protein
MPDLPIDTIPAVVVPEVEPRPSGTKPIRCEFCKSQLAPNGDVLKRGEDATIYMKQADQIAELQSQLEKARNDDAAVRRELAECRAIISANENPKKKLGGFWS